MIILTWVEDHASKLASCLISQTVDFKYSMEGQHTFTIEDWESDQAKTAIEEAADELNEFINIYELQDN